MKNFLRKLGVLAIALLSFGSVAFAASTLSVPQGGSGISSLTGIIRGNGVSPFSAIPDGLNGQILSTNGAGTYSFITASGTGTIGGTVAAGRVGYGSALDTLASDANFLWNSTTKIFSILDTGDEWFRVNAGTGIVRMGDLSIGQNGTSISVFDNSKTIEMGGQNITYTSVTFVGGGLNNLSYNQFFTGSTPTTYTITLASTGIPDRFNWSDTSGNSATNVAITGGAQTLSNGITISFGTTTGHTIGNQWSFTAGVSWATKFRFDNQSQIYTIGDVDDSFNGTVFSLNDSTANQTAYLRADTQFQIDAGQVFINGGQRDSYVYAGANTNRTILVTDYKVGMNPLAGDVTATLPASPSNGDTYVIGDALGNASIGTNDIVVSGNGHNIQSIATDTISQAWKWREYTYDSSTNIWHIISNQ